MTGDKKKAAIDIVSQLINMSSELDELSSRARWIEDNIDNIRYELLDLYDIDETELYEDDEEEEEEE